MNILKEAVLILAVVWFGFLIAGEIQKIYYAWQHQKVQKIYNDTLRMLSERIRSRIKKDGKIYIDVVDQLPDHHHPETEKEELHGTEHE